MLLTGIMSFLQTVLHVWNLWSTTHKPCPHLEGRDFLRYPDWLLKIVIFYCCIWQLIAPDDIILGHVDYKKSYGVYVQIDSFEGGDKHRYISDLDIQVCMLVVI